MKRIYKTVLLALALNCGMAQTPFWTPTAFKGAFAPSPTNMWTDTWAEWDPQVKVYPSATQIISANITTNTTWTTGQTYLLQGQIYVKNNAVLTIQPGVVVLGDKSVAGSGLFITRGAKLIANGTAAQPIVFTSDQAPGSRTSGDWGGIIIMGNGSNNSAGGTNYVEGLATSTDTQYGGGSTPNDNDNSGSLLYVRIEFPGYVYQPNKEINGLTLGAVGRGTVIDFVQVSFSNDDGFEWFGGAVNCKHLVSYRNLDDDFDTDNGFSGNIQYGLIVRDPAIADNPSVSTSEGFESDNDATGSTNSPLTSALFSNITVIGPFRGNTAATIATGYRRGARLRRNTNLKIFNSIFMDFPRGIHIDGTACETNATGGMLKYKYNVVAGTTTGMVTEHNSGSTFNTPSFFGANNNDSLVTTTGILTTPYNYTSPDYRPVSTNPLVATGADFGDPTFASAGVVGINDVAAIIKNAQLYPNPSSGKTSIVLNSENGLNLSVTLYNVTGQLVSTPYSNYEIPSGTAILNFDVAELPSGIYFLNVSSGEQKETFKLIVNN
jgi:hypothetical protein